MEIPDIVCKKFYLSFIVVLWVLLCEWFWCLKFQLLHECINWLQTWSIYLSCSCPGPSSWNHCLPKHSAISWSIYIQRDCGRSNWCAYLLCQHKLHQGQVRTCISWIIFAVPIWKLNCFGFIISLTITRLAGYGNMKLQKMDPQVMGRKFPEFTLWLLRWLVSFLLFESFLLRTVIDSDRSRYNFILFWL